MLNRSVGLLSKIRAMCSRTAAAPSARSLKAGEDFAVCEWTASTGSKEWDGVDVFPLRDGRILRKDVYSSSHRPREL